MEPELSPVIIYTVREYRDDLTLAREHIFIGNILDESTVKNLNQGRKDPTDKQLKPFFEQFKVDYTKGKAIQNYYPILIEFNDTWNQVREKIKSSIKTDDFYFWHDNVDSILTHHFLYKNKVVKINSNPFKANDPKTNQTDINRLFEAYGNLSLVNKTNYLVRSMLKPNQNVLSLVTGKVLTSLAKKTITSSNSQVFLNRFNPPNLEYQAIKSIDESSCLINMLRDDSLPSGKNYVKISKIRIEQCNIEINRNDDDSFINLDTIFQLIPLDESLIFTKMRKQDRSVSKVSKKVQKFKSQVSKDLLSEWANIDDHHKGLLYRKLKNTPGLVIYKIHDNGFIQLEINWTSDSRNQIEEIRQEVDELNKFIDRINKINYQLPEKENLMIQKADERFINDPNSSTYFVGFNLKTWIDTNKQQISWNAFNYLSDTFTDYLAPVFNWRIYNKKDLRREIGGISESNIHYTKTNNNLEHEDIHSILFSLGLVGSISKEQTVTVEQQKEIIINQQDKFESNVELDRSYLDDKIRQIKEGNPGVLVNITFDGNYYVLNIKGAHNLYEIKEINAIMQKVFQYYFYIGTVYKYIKNYNCQRLSWILSSSEKIDEQIKEKTVARSSENIPQQVVEDVFDIEELEDEEEEMAEPSFGIGEIGSTEESFIPRDLAEIPEDEEVTTSGTKKVKSVLEYLKDVSPIFKTEYRRHGCTTNLPVVMSISDFWNNYKRLIKRFEEFKAKLKDKDIDEYQKKFKKDLETRDWALDKFKRRVEFVMKKTTITLDKKILAEIIDIADRYHKGALMQVPLNKKKTEYSREHFYLCPLRWCHFCRESRLLDEIEDGKVCKICNNKLYQLQNQKNSFIGFPSSKKYPHINCLPCCFKNISKFNKKIAECNITHPTKKIQKPVEKSQPNISHILTGDVIPFNRFGYLDGEATGKLNNFFNDGAMIDKIKNNQEVFLLKGVNDVGEKDAFLEAISYFRHPKKDRLKPDEIRDYLANIVNEELFPKLSNGLIASIFKTPENTWSEALDEFKLFIMQEPLNEDLLWHLISMPGVILENGYNLLIIHRTQSLDEKEHKYTMLCPIGLRMEDYFDPNKFTAVMLKLENNIYYPIAKVTCMIDYNNIISCGREAHEQWLFENQDDRHIQELYEYAMDNCKYPINIYERDRLDLEETLKELEKTDYLKEHLYLRINPYYQVTEIILEIKSKNKNKIFTIPIKPTPMPLETSDLYKKFQDIQFEFKKIEDDVYTNFNESMDIIKTLAKKTKLPIKIRHYLKNSNNMVYGLKLENGLVMRFDPVNEDTFRQKDFPIVLDEDPEEIDAAIIEHNKMHQDERQEYVNKTTFQKESYQRLRFELSRFLSKDKNINNDIVEVLDSDKSVNSKRSAIEKIIKPVINTIAVIETPKLQNYKLPQIRQLCSTQKECGNDPHCYMDNNKCKVLLPKTLILPNDTHKKNTLNRYVVLIADEILRNVIKRTELLQGKVSIYVNPSQMVYHSKQEILINEPNYQSQIEDLYSRTIDYHDLIRRHYFVQPSEVFTREVEQNLHYFAEESWYKNTGLSRNDFIMNSKNIYDLLADIFGEDLGEKLWAFISKHDWKKWLNAFRTILPDEYQNIYQHSQFMEHIKYGRSTITDLHLSIISHLYNVKIIVMNRSAVGSKKFHCLGTTQAQSTSKTYLIFYKYDDLDTYLVGKTPHIDLTIDKDVMYLFKEDKIPQKFFKLWAEQCKSDHKVQKSPDSPDYLIKGIALSTEYDTFVDDLKEVPDITQEKIIPPPKTKPEAPGFSLLPEEDEEAEAEPEAEEEEVEEEKKPSPKIKIKMKKKLTLAPKKSPPRSKEKSPPKLKFKPASRPKSRSRSRSPPKLSFKAKPKAKPAAKLAFKKKPPTRGRSRSVSRGRPRSRSVSRGRPRSRSTSRGKQKITLKFKKR